MKIAKRILFTFLILLLVLGGTGLWLLFGSRTSNPKNYAHIGEIPTPSGYERVVGTTPGYTQFLRALPPETQRQQGTPLHGWQGLLSTHELCCGRPSSPVQCRTVRRCLHAFESGILLSDRAIQQYPISRRQWPHPILSRWCIARSLAPLSSPPLWRRQHLLPLSRNAAPHIGRNPTWRCLCLPRQRSISRSRRPRSGRRCQQGREKGLSPRRGQHAGLRHSSHPQLRKPISLPVVYDRRQREEIPLISHPLQSNRLEA